MIIFKDFPSDSKCFICKTNEDKPATLIGIAGTEEGGNMQATVVHVDCIELTLFESDHNYIIAQMIEKEEQYDPDRGITEDK